MRTDLGNVYPTPAQKPGPAAGWPGVKSELIQCVCGVLMVLGLLTVAQATRSISYVGPVFAHGAMFAQLWWPMARADAQKCSLAALGLTTHHAGREILWGLGTASMLLPCWAGLVWVWQHGLSEALGMAPFVAAQPMGYGALALALLNHTLGVALPEELFWRGYVQPVWQQAGAKKAQWTWGTTCTCLVFGLGHVMGGSGTVGLATALPAVAFALLRNRRGRVVGAITLHAACNVFAAWWLTQI